MMKLIIEAYPIMAFKMQLPDKTRKYMKIIEAEDYQNGEIVCRTLYRYVITDRIMSEDGTKIERMVGYHKKVSPISNHLQILCLKTVRICKRYAVLPRKIGVLKVIRRNDLCFTELLYLYCFVSDFCF